MISQPSDSKRPMRVVIIGGGLAGMAAAVALESAGADVSLIESRRSLGGRAGSFIDPQTGEELDNCQHVVLGCCTNLIDFYRRIGADHLIRWSRTIHFRDDAGRYDLFAVANRPAPLHLGPALFRFGALSWREKVELARAMIAMMSIGRRGRQRLADMPFGAWLDEQRQSPALVRKLYDAVLVGALNENTRDASAAYAIQVFQDSLLANERGYLIGVPNCTLAELYRKLPCKDVKLGTRAAELIWGATRVEGVKLASGEHLPADAVVIATNHHALDRLVPPARASGDRRFAHLDRLVSVPILGAHLWFDRPVMTDPHAALLNGPLQWLFRKDDAGRSLHGVISAARDWIDRPKEDMLRQFETQVRRTLPAARDARLDRGVVVIEKRATFAPLPGSDRYRPDQSPAAGGIANLFLAGDYTQTGWPATMEGAVRSGYLAADGILARSRTRSFLVNDLNIQWPARFFGLDD